MGFGDAVASADHMHTQTICRQDALPDAQPTNSVEALKHCLKVYPLSCCSCVMRQKPINETDSTEYTRISQ